MWWSRTRPGGQALTRGRQPASSLNRRAREPTRLARARNGPKTTQINRTKHVREGGERSQMLLNYILKRLLQLIPLLIAVSILIFIIIQLPPGDYLTTYIIQL